MDRRVLQESVNWDQINRRPVSPGMIATVYSYLCTEYNRGDSLEVMQHFLGLDSELISHCIQLLENYGYITASRSTKPFLYAVIK